MPKQGGRLLLVLGCERAKSITSICLLYAQCARLLRMWNSVESEDGVERLFFDLASEIRLGILRKLQAGNLRMPELTRQLDLTATETFRQLQRLGEAKLVQKQVDGSYSITQFGNLTLSIASSMEFIYKNKQYFLEHDVWQLPLPFLNRIGELSNSVFISEMAAIMNAMERIIGEAQSFVWIMTDQFLDSHSRILTERRQEGVHFRSLLHEKLYDNERATQLYKGQIVERRFLPKIAAVLIITEKEAAIALPLVGGKADPTGFVGTNPVFLKWASDLYFHYWEQGKRAQSFGITSK